MPLLELNVYMVNKYLLLRVELIVITILLLPRCNGIFHLIMWLVLVSVLVSNETQALIYNYFLINTSICIMKMPKTIFQACVWLTFYWNGFLSIQSIDNKLGLAFKPLFWLWLFTSILLRCIWWPSGQALLCRKTIMHNCWFKALACWPVTRGLEYPHSLTY